MKKIILFALLVMQACVLKAQSFKDLKTSITTALQQEKLMGAVWGIVDSNGTVYTDGTGIKNADTREALTAANKVNVGSIAKTVLAAGILHLATQGKINLDTPVNRYLPDVHFKNKWERNNPVTTRHLLNHTSGLRDIQLWQFFSNTASPETPLSEFYHRQPEVLTIQEKPGDWFSYSNMGYALLGMIIEAVTKQSYEQYLDTEILQPLGMLHSSFAFVSQTGVNKDTQLAMGHLNNAKVFPAYPIYVRPAGQLTTTAYDMALFVKFLMSNGKINGKPFIDSLYLSQMGYAQNTKAQKAGLPFGYTYGLLRRDKNGVLSFFNNGNIVGYYANIYLFPEHKKAFFIAHNMDSETADYSLFDELIINHLGINKINPVAQAQSTTGLETWSGYYVPLIEKYNPFGIFDIMFSYTKVIVQKDRIILQPFGDKSNQLSYIGNSLFIASDKVRVSHAFIKDELNRQVITDGRKNLKKVNGWKILLLWLSFAVGLLGIIYLLLLGIIVLLKQKKQFIKSNYFPVFAGICILLGSSFFVFMQQFNEIGNKSIANVFLAITTMCFPFFIISSIWKMLVMYKTKAFTYFPFIANLLVFQLLIVLLYNGLLPLYLWK